MTSKERMIWDEVDREPNQKQKFKLVLAAFVESDEDFIREIREDASFIINDPDLTDKQKKESVDMILSTMKAKRAGIERKNYRIAGK